MATFNTSDLLSSIRARGSIPTTTNSSNVNNSTNLLSMATEELHIKLLPLIMSVREEFYVAPPKDHTIVEGTAAYAVPTRASGMVLRDVQLIQSTNVYSLPRISPEQVATTARGAPEGYYLEHNKVVLYPTPAASGDTLRLRYYMRPSRLIATTACAQIASIDTETSSVGVSSIPSSWATGTVIDFVAQHTPNQCRAIDQAISSVASTTITFTELPSDLAIGDWVAPAEYTPLPQLPFEFHPVLAQMTVVKALEAIGDRDGARAALQDLQIVQQAALQLITNRNHGENKRVVVRRWR